MELIVDGCLQNEVKPEVVLEEQELMHPAARIQQLVLHLSPACFEHKTSAPGTRHRSLPAQASNAPVRTFSCFQP